MRYLRGTFLSVILICGFIISAPVAAQSSAEAETTVTVNFPEILVLYTFSAIELNLDATFLADNLGLGAATPCAVGATCVDAGSATETDVGASTDMDISALVPADGGLNNVVLTLVDALGARSLGLTDTNYTLGVVDQGDTDVLNLGSGQPVSFSNTGLLLSTSDLVLEIDPNEIVDQTDSVQVVETFVITVSGT